MQIKCSDTAATTALSLLSTIKKELRANMNGVASATMRQTDDYRVNFGVELPRLTQIAAEFQPNHELADLLWKESVRECRILATILQPVETFDPEIADIWVDSIHTAEIAQIASINLFQKMPNASVKAFEWIASESEIRQICGYSTIWHLMRTKQLSERSREELADQLAAIPATANIALQRITNNIKLALAD